jgi:hypothetical protein
MTVRQALVSQERDCMRKRERRNTDRRSRDRTRRERRNTDRRRGQPQ